VEWKFKAFGLIRQGVIVELYAKNALGGTKKVR
jgi:hypothetical protein